MEPLNVIFEENRELSHPSRVQWDLFLVRGLAESEHRRLEHHLQGCGCCQSRYEELKVERSNFQAEADLPAFVSALEEKLSRPSTAVLFSGEAVDASTAFASPDGEDSIVEEPAHARRKEWSGWTDRLQRFFRPLVLAPLAACAVMLLVLFSEPETQGPSGSACLSLDKLSASGVRRKGAPELRVFLFRNNQRSLVTPGVVFAKGDILALRYKSSGYKYLSVVYLDNKGVLSFLYPNKPAPSLAVLEGGDLQGSIQLDGAKGTERLLAFFSSRSLEPKDIRALLKRQPKPGPVRLRCSSPNRIFLQQVTIPKE